MTVVVPPGFAQVGVELKHDLDPDPWYITFGIDLSLAGGDIIAASLNVVDAWSASWKAETSTAVAYRNTRLVVGQDGGDNLILTIPVSGVRGLKSSQVLPQNCAALVTKFTDLGGRKHRGRYYVPACIAEGEVDAVGNISTPAHEALQNAAAEFRDRLEFGSNPANVPTPMVILHNEYVPQPAPTTVTGTSVAQLIATQRRRLR